MNMPNLIQEEFQILKKGEEIKVEFLDPNKGLPIMLTPRYPGLDVKSFIETNQTQIIDILEKYGAILFRDFGLNDVESFYKMVGYLGLNLLDYKERSSPRHEVSPKVYTSTDHPSDQLINMHNESSYSKVWPLKIMFYCDIPAPKRGETPIADSRKVLNALKPSTIQKFREKGIMYVRNLGGNLGLDWREVFRTEDKSVIEDHCRKNNMEYEWIENDRLRLKYTGPAVRRHPNTNEESWFNHGFFFNIRSLNPEFLEEILLIMEKEDFPFLSFYGDGTEIEEEVIEEIRSIYNDLIVEFKWQKGDFLLLDNMLVAHGRNPFEGNRKILVAMSEAQHNSDYV